MLPWCSTSLRYRRVELLFTQNAKFWHFFKQNSDIALEEVKAKNGFYSDDKLSDDKFTCIRPILIPVVGGLLQG